VAVASHAYVAARGLPGSPEALSAHACVLGAEAGVRTHVRWPLLDGGSVPVAGRIASNDLGVQLRATLAGHGIGLMPSPFAQEAIARGLLVQVLPDHIGLRTSMSIVYVERALMPAKVRAFVDHVAAAFDRPADDILRRMTADVFGELMP
jgi:DNA-binding transcriptional LysR family regulator